MRINIKIKGKPLRDDEVKALYIINYALQLCSKRMILPTLEFFAGRYNFLLIHKSKIK